LARCAHSDTASNTNIILTKSSSIKVKMGLDL
jgi:hypothetical protein